MCKTIETITLSWIIWTYGGSNLIHSKKDIQLYELLRCIYALNLNRINIKQRILWELCAYNKNWNKMDHRVKMHSLLFIFVQMGTKIGPEVATGVVTLEMLSIRIRSNVTITTELLITIRIRTKMRKITEEIIAEIIRTVEVRKIATDAVILIIPITVSNRIDHLSVLSRETSAS